MITAYHAIITLTLGCDAPDCQTPGLVVSGPTVGEAMQVAREAGWSLWPGRYYCPAHPGPYPAEAVLFDGPLVGGKVKRLPVERIAR